VTMTQINREALVAKLDKMGLTTKHQFRLNHATVAVEEFVAFHGGGDRGEAEVTSSGMDIDADVMGDIDAVCPKCAHAWTMKGVEVSGDVSIEGWEVVDATEVEYPAPQDPHNFEGRPGALVLEQSEIALILLDWVSMQEGIRE
jgi:hypothetical protein